MKAKRIFGIAQVELLRLIRSRMSITLLLIVPALQVLLFGYAIRPTANSVSVAIAAPSPESAKSIAEALARQPGLRISASALKPGEAEVQVRQKRAMIGVEVPASRSFADPFVVRRPLRIIVDAANASLTTAAVARIEAAYWHEITVRADVEGNGPGLKIERLYNPDQRADWTFLPSLVGVTVMISMIMLGSLSLAREREGGTWETLQAMPGNAVEALLGKLLPYAVLGTLQGLSVLAIGFALFDLPMRGSVGGLAILLPLFAAAHLVMGYAISARATTQLAALQGAVAFYLPAMLLSGFLYPFETLPPWARVIGNAFPLTHFIAAAQDATLRAADTPDVLANGLPIGAFLVIITAIALLAGRRRLE
jgi:ABC-2 type transport system permease protein